MTKVHIYLFYFSIFILLFCGAGVLFSMGWMIDYSNAPFYQKLRPEFYLLFVILFSVNISKKTARSVTHSTPIKLKYIRETYNKKLKISNLRKGAYILFFFLITIMYWALTGQMKGYAAIINPLVIPALIFMLLQVVPSRAKQTIFYIIVAFYVINCLLAIYSTTTGINIFPYYSSGESDDADTIYDISLFRATALRNHPLGNSLLTSIILSFIVVTDKIKGYYKLLLIMLGYTSLMCFNSRSSLMIVPVFTALYIFYCIFITKSLRINKLYLIFGILILASVVYYLFDKGYGGRLLEDDNLNDSSVEARLMLFKWFLSADYTIFLFGMSDDQISQVVKMAHIENWVILYLLRMGIFIFAGYVYLFYKLLKDCCSRQTKAVISYVVLSTFVIATTNNSIYNGEPVLSLFVLCAYSLFPERELSKRVLRCNHQRVRKIGDSSYKH